MGSVPHTHFEPVSKQSLLANNGKLNYVMNSVTQERRFFELMTSLRAARNGSFDQWEKKPVSAVNRIHGT